MEETAPRKRRLPHPVILLMASLVLFVGIAAGSIWVPYDNERASIEDIVKLGGSVEVQPGGPDWLRKRIGDEWMRAFDRATTVHLWNNPKIGDGEVGCISSFSELQFLFLHQTDVTDAGLRKLTRLTKLRVLTLSNTRITDAGLESLASMKSLRLLYVSNSGVTSEGIARLQARLPDCDIR